MQDRSALIKMPAYLQGFRCLGPACEDHCCYGWDVIVDQQSYRRYRELPSTELGKAIRKAIRREKRDSSKASYARFLRTGEACPFLTPERLCRIHAELGEDFLPDTCFAFPRHFRARREWIEISASLACPEIARRALEDPRGIDLVEVRPDAADAGLPRGVEPRLQAEVEAAGLALRHFALTLLKDRRHALWQRILALGFLLETVSVSGEARGKGDMPFLLEEFAGRMDSGPWKERMESAPVLTGLQLQLVRRLHDEMIPAVKVKALKECAGDCLAGLDYAGAKPFTEEVGRRYDSAYDQYYRPFLDRYGFMLENYLVNYLLHHNLCFHQGRRLYDDYVMMVLNFAMVKTYLIGMAARHGEGMNTAMVTRLIYSFTKVVEPDSRFRDYSLGLLAQSDCTDMMHLAVLIRN